ncbi:hypothetical protein ROHU_021307 [Labeo rohita]|uniref:Uncharacterized protein n=1 Tax=Labeo rohita TaxID=84645 RepID=A0A498MV92_LABRO|nr:hypothetical protein ROHU_033016 [Labeo rohita]RXN25748.1 hypothetical protein ROHU_021307 [Labeo rohita]
MQIISNYLVLAVPEVVYGETSRHILSIISFILLNVSIFLHVFYSVLDLRKSQRWLDSPRIAHGPSEPDQI